MKYRNRSHLVLPLSIIATVMLTSFTVAAHVVWPISGRISSNYNSCRDNCTRLHGAIDIAGSTGDAVGASFNGRVSFAAISGSLTSGYGRLVIVDHKDSYQTYYAHNDSFAVSSGIDVAQLQTISYRGSTGTSTGPHVHFEIRQFGSKLFIPGSIDTNVIKGNTINYDYPGLDNPPLVSWLLPVVLLILD